MGIEKSSFKFSSRVLHESRVQVTDKRKPTRLDLYSADLARRSNDEVRCRGCAGQFVCVTRRQAGSAGDLATHLGGTDNPGRAQGLI